MIYDFINSKSYLKTRGDLESSLSFVTIEIIGNEKWELEIA